MAKFSTVHDADDHTGVTDLFDATSTDHDAHDHTGVPGVGGSTSLSGAKAYTTGVAITNAVITFAAEVYDTDTYHDTSSATSRLTVPSDGTYYLDWAGFTSRTDCRIEVRLNGAAVIGGNRAGASAGNYTHGSGTYPATTGQYFELMAVTVASTTFGDNGDIGDNFTFEITKVG